MQARGEPAETANSSTSRRRRPSRRDEILRRTAHLFLAQGFEIVSLLDVARACGISKAGLYYHFRSKQELLAAIISYAQDLHEEEVKKVLSVSSGDDADDLRRVIHSHAMMMTQEDDAAFAILAVDEIRSLLPADREQIARRKRSYLGVIRERLTRLAAAGRLRDVDITMATHTLAGMVLWLPKWYRQPGRLSAEQMADEITKLAMNSVLADGDSSS
jgi:TetR/AcrR family transcriptional regulator, cholesterol catabolism regulator